MTCGSAYTFQVDGYTGSQVWLVQTKNGNQNYSGILNVPQTYTTVCNSQEGTYVNTVYTVASGQKGTLLGSVTVTVNPQAVSVTPRVYVNAQAVSQFACGQTETFTVDGYTGSQIWLYQTRDGAQTYNGIASVPITYTTSCATNVGNYASYVYTVSGGEPGTYLGAVSTSITR